MSYSNARMQTVNGKGLSMNWDTRNPVMIAAGGAVLNGRCFGPCPRHAPTLVLLHEGLGSVELWRGFPQALAEATGYGVFAYDRRGYGRSSGHPAPWPVDYMTREAEDVLPGVLDALDLREGILVGHSDGASIAAIHLGRSSDARIRGAVLMAPHFFAEEMGLAAIAQARKAFEEGGLRARLARYHDHVDDAFGGWNGGWLTPAFKAWNIEGAIDGIGVPVLAIQGANDQYGTQAQIDTLERRLNVPFTRLILDGCGHSPHIEKPQATLAAITEFVKKLAEDGRISPARGTMRDRA